MGKRNQGGEMIKRKEGWADGLQWSEYISPAITAVATHLQERTESGQSPTLKLQILISNELRLVRDALSMCEKHTGTGNTPDH
ncbi:unnamed protein product [Caretta caretta]